MKNLLPILFLLITSSAFAIRVNHYFSNSGNDLNNGLTIGAAQATIAKLNSSFASYSAGDSILFERGGTFYGTIIVNKSGTAALPITIGAYGTGAQPIITGFTTLSGWTNEGLGIYSKIIASAAKTNMVTIDGVQKAMGRYPDATYLSYETYSTNVSITDNTLGSATNWATAEAVIRKNDWTLERCNITNHTGNTLTYTSTGTTQYGSNNFGYFIQNDLRTVTSYGEWYHNTGTGKFYMYFGGVDPNTKTVKVATVNNILYNSGQDYIIIDNLNFIGSIDNAIHFTGGTDNDNVQNCTISLAGQIGMKLSAGTGTTINNNIISKCNRTGIASDGTSAVITNNTVRDIGLIPGQVLGQGGYEGIYTPGLGNVIRYNNIKNTGYNGISIRYTGAVTVQYNFIDSVCLTLDDGGGIYTSSPNNSIRNFDHNIILNVIGNSTGTPNNTPLSAGIYLDESATNVTVNGNTVANVSYAGTKLHYAHNNTVVGNLMYNTLYAISYEDNAAGGISANSIRRNIFFAKTATQNVLRATSGANNVTTMTVADSNYYARPIDDNLSIFTSQPSTGGVNRNLAGWKTFSGQDAHSLKAPKTITSTSELSFYYNASDVVSTVSFPGLKKMGVDGTVYNNTAPVQRWSGIVLIDNGSAGNIPPVARAGTDQIITLPTNSVSVSGSASTDADGSISGYAWLKISGPASGTIAAAAVSNTAINGLVQGVYKFELTVTDNGGAIGKDTVQVTVNPAPNTSPNANAGSDITITLPVNSANLTGTGSDAEGPVTFSWTKISGPAGGATSATTANTTVTSLQQGTYRYQLTVTDNVGATKTDLVDVNVLPAVPPVNQAPVSNAGLDIVITLPTNTTTLNGSGTDADGTITAYAWVKIAGPVAGTIATPNAATTALNGLVQGVYQFQLTVTDNSGATNDTASNTVQVTVNAAPINIAPNVSAGGDYTIALPLNTVNITATATDVDGTISDYGWVKISGPATFTIVNQFSAITDVNNLVQGVYQFEVTATDNGGATDKDTVQVTVTPPATNINPVANAGRDTLLIMPDNNISFVGSGSDADGTISTYVWREGATVLGTSATLNLIAVTLGAHNITLTVSDDLGGTGSDTVIVTVQPPPVAPCTQCLIINRRLVNQ
jgi:parallel beta-helix repeat protein